MLVVGVLNGYSASSQRTNTEDVVRKTLYASELIYEMTAMRSSLFLPKHRAMTRYLQARSGKDRTLLLVGKSLGAKHMAEHVLPKMSGLPWKGIYVLTLDPNWPVVGDWSPNLNESILELLSGEISAAANVYVESSDVRQQCGARVACDSVHVTNTKLLACHGYTHYNFVTGATVRGELELLLKKAEECDEK